MTGTLDDPLLRWIPLLPLLSAVVHGVSIGFVRRALPRAATVALSCGTVLASFVASAIAFATWVQQGRADAALVDVVYTWIGAGLGERAFSVDVALRFDPLSAVMCLLVTVVGFAIHVYSVGYMGEDEREDRGFQRYFAYLNLFVASMLVLVLADGPVLAFLGWEGVGVCSYLLIGFWYAGADNARAAQKALVVNRIGDAGFLVGVLLVFWALAEGGAPSTTWAGLEAALPSLAARVVALPAALGGLELPFLDVVGLCFFVGACGKSAQLPLHVWLPDAMAGPTPVSALIHAATMVTAGVYLVARMSFLYAEAELASTVIAWVGASTAVYAALAAVAQTDLKKVLAYSTLSQLGYMFLAAGAGAFTAAMFHVVTHAFFKALLFLGAGSVLLAVHHQQDMTKLGGLGKRLPKTRLAMLIGVLALAGMPGFSGFFSKDEIVAAVYASHLPGRRYLLGMALGTAFVTSFYAFRMYFLVFRGESRVESRIRSTMHEPGDSVMFPLYALAALSILGGYVGLPQFWGDMMLPPEVHSDSLGNFLASVVVRAQHDIPRAQSWALVVVATAAFAGGLVAAWLVYVRAPSWIVAFQARTLSLQAFARGGFGVDALYARALVAPLRVVADRVLFRGVDALLIDRVAVEGVARAVRGIASGVLRHAQSGLVQTYLFFLVAGSVAIALFLVG